jgi:ABC-type multidrug transport system ATPase subunit
LELGVGFHPDLTGEENIYLNGAMLGFDSDKMRKRFDEIVSFSEIGDFIYSPIRTYSSGMLMRLGFSVAMCVNPDILLIDEVLAVGDEAFQKKCLKQLEEFKTARKTIVIVSHALDMVKKFCGRAILLHEGRLITDGTADKTIDKYHAILSTKERVHGLDGVADTAVADVQVVHEIIAKEETEEAKRDGREKREREEETRVIEEIVPQKPIYERYGTFEAEIVEVILRNEKGQEANTFPSGERMAICLKIRFHRDIKDPIVGFYIRKYELNRPIDIYGMNTRWRGIKSGSFKRGERIEVKFLHTISIPEGTYYIVAAIAYSDETRFYDWLENVRPFTIKNEGQLWTGLVNLNSQILINRRL